MNRTAISIFISLVLFSLSGSAFADPGKSKPCQPNASVPIGQFSVAQNLFGFLDLRHKGHLVPALHGVDIAHWNKVDYSQLQSCGTSFAFVKLDPKRLDLFYSAISRFTELAIPALPYYYLTVPGELKYFPEKYGTIPASYLQAEAIGRAQADAFLKIYAKTDLQKISAIGNLSGSIIALDVEDMLDASSCAALVARKAFPAVNDCKHSIEIIHAKCTKLIEKKLASDQADCAALKKKQQTLLSTPFTTTAMEEARMNYGAFYLAVAASWIRRVKEKYPKAVIVLYLSPNDYVYLINKGRSADFILIRGLPAWLAEYLPSGGEPSFEADDDINLEDRDALATLAPAQQLCLSATGGNKCIFNQYSSLGSFAILNPPQTIDLDRFYFVSVKTDIAGQKQYVRGDGY